MEVVRKSITFEEQIAQINPSELIARKLENRQVQLSLEERIALLVGCIRMGEERVLTMREQASQNPIMILGNTGSGKSTLINYLAGCEMEYINPETIGVSAPSDVVIVKHESRQKEIMKIGHTKISETFIPDIASGNGRVYCDCPGFLDNRGAEINVANIVNTRRVMEASQGVRIIILINHHSLLADKARGLRETIKVTKQLFGNERNFTDHQDSILIGVTQVPEKSRREPVRSLDRLKKLFLEVKSDDTFESKITKVFAQHLFIYHPLDETEELSYLGGVKREELLAMIDSMKQVTDPCKLFHNVLTPEDEKELREICQGMSEKIVQSLESEEYEDANMLLEFTYQIREVDHPEIIKLIAGCKETVIAHFMRLAQQIEEELVANSRELTEKAERLFTIITSGISAFGEEDVGQFEQAIGLSNLRQRYAHHATAIQFFSEESRIKAMEREFNSKCVIHDFQGAQRILNQIQEKVDAVDSRFAESNLECDIDIDALAGDLARARQIKQEIDNKEEAYRREKEEWAKKVAETKHAAEAERAQFQAELSQNNQQLASLASEVSYLQSQRFAYYESSVSSTPSRRRGNKASTQRRTVRTHATRTHHRRKKGGKCIIS